MWFLQNWSMPFVFTGGGAFFSSRNSKNMFLLVEGVDDGGVAE